jgi:hypothetical protein
MRAQSYRLMPLVVIEVAGVEGLHGHVVGHLERRLRHWRQLAHANLQQRRVAGGGCSRNKAGARMVVVVVVE